MSVLALSKPPSQWWLFSPGTDLGVFLGSAAASLLALWVGARVGVLGGSTPDWAWVPAVLLVDVAHVYSTGFRVYFDGNAFRRRPLLYTLTPVLGLALGMVLYAQGSMTFWRVLAYIAVFHFVRQQYGWVALYRGRLREKDDLGRVIDTAAIYSATLYPLIWWHTHLPRHFWWFMPQDFAALPSILERLAWPVYILSLGLYALKSLHAWLIGGTPNPGKDIVVVTTVVCWYVGIIGYNSDYAFTVTNVLTHGIPYLALVYWYGHKRWLDSGQSGRLGLFAHSPVPYLFILWILAYLEEMLWDRTVWQEHAWLFGQPWNLEHLHVFLVPLLALPQITHYILDGFVWRKKSNPELMVSHAIKLS